MHSQPDRIEQFKADIADLRIADPSTSRDRLATRVGVAAMAVGVVLPIVAYAMSHGTTNPLAPRDSLVLAVLGVALAVAGGALYLQSALAPFLCFWLLRAIHSRPTPTPPPPAAWGTPGDLPWWVARNK